MATAVDSFDLRGLRLTSGEGRRLDLAVRIEPFELGGDTYAVEPDLVPVRLDISRTTGEGYALRLRFDATLRGQCMRCLEPAIGGPLGGRARDLAAGAGDELDSPYVDGGMLASEPGPAMRWRSTCPGRSSVAVTAPDFVRSAVPISTTLDRNIITTPSRTPAGRSCQRSSSRTETQQGRAGLLA